MTRYIITVDDPDMFPTIDIPCESLEELERELLSWTQYVAYGIVLDVYKFDETTLDYDLVDHIEA